MKEKNYKKLFLDIKNYVEDYYYKTNLAGYGDLLSKIKQLERDELKDRKKKSDS